MVASLINLRIPKTGVAMIPLPKNIFSLLPDRTCNRRLWQDKLGQISLAVTTLFWGVSGNLRYLGAGLGGTGTGLQGETKASNLVGVVAIGTAVGAVWASLRVKPDRATQVMPLGILMGLVVLALLVIKGLGLAILFVLLGGLGGYLVVPMNALLQHRGHSPWAQGAQSRCRISTNRPAFWGWGFSIAS